MLRFPRPWRYRSVDVWSLLVLLAISMLAPTGCGPKLPEPDSAGAQLYQQRCAGCHRLHHPSVMKAEMWKLMVQRMQGEFARRGIPTLDAQEEKTLLDYLQRNSG